MKVLIIGATGECGIQLIRCSLTSGHTVIVYARSPQKLPPDVTSHPSITVIKGELQDEEKFKSALTAGPGDGQPVDAVMSALGPVFGQPKGAPIATALKEVLIPAMKEVGIRRLLWLSTASHNDPKDKVGLRWKAIINAVKYGASTAYAEILAAADAIIAETNNLDYTLVRVPTLLNGEKDEYNAGYLGEPSTGYFLNRKGFGKFCIDEIESPQWIGKAPMISLA